MLFRSRLILTCDEVGDFWTAGGRIWPVPSYLPVSWYGRLELAVDSNWRPHYLWTGWNNGEGHGKPKDNGVTRYTHRMVYEKVTGRTLKQFDYVDHLADVCGHKPCCNFDHLEPVHPGVNVARGAGRLTQFKVIPDRGATRITIGYGDPLDALG